MGIQLVELTFERIKIQGGEASFLFFSINLDSIVLGFFTAHFEVLGFFGLLRPGNGRWSGVQAGGWESRPQTPTVPGFSNLVGFFFVSPDGGRYEGNQEDSQGKTRGFSCPGQPSVDGGREGGGAFFPGNSPSF